MLFYSVSAVQCVGALEQMKRKESYLTLSQRQGHWNDSVVKEVCGKGYLERMWMSSHSIRTEILVFIGAADFKENYVPLKQAMDQRQQCVP